MTTEPSTDQRTPDLSSRPDTLAAMLAERASWLRGEVEATDDAVAKAVLLHELGVMQERAGDDPGAARDYLAAFNSDPTFREPLEAMVALLQRRRSVKNLGKLLDALVRGAATVDEASRALVEKAGFLLDHGGDVEGARQALREAVAENPDEVAAWLELELLAAREGDAVARVEALSERAARVDSPTWRGLLLLDLAALEAASGDLERAAATCRAAAALEGAARFRAYEVLADLARKAGDDGLFSEAIEAQYELVSSAIEATDGGAAADAEGVPSYVRSAAFAVDLLLQAAEARRRSGDAAGAASAIERAASRLAGERSLAWLHLAEVSAAGDVERAGSIAKSLLQTGVTGPEAAALSMRVHRAASAQGDREASLAALRQAVAADPGGVLARGLLVDALSSLEGAREGAELAAVIEGGADHVEARDAKVRVALRAAWEWATSASDTSRAREAIVRAVQHGLPRQTAARVARVLAAVSGDDAWYEAATAESIDALGEDAAGSGEAVGLWFEALRARAVRADVEGVRAAHEGLERSAGGAWLAKVLAAFVVKSGGATPSERAALLEGLARLEPTPAVGRALDHLAAWVEQAGDRAAAVRRLSALHEQDPADLAVASQLARLLRDEGDVAGAARVVQAAAASTEDPAASAALYLEAGVLLWGADQRGKALENFRAAHLSAPSAASPLLLWAMRGAEPDRTATRRQAIELAVEAGADASASALERFGLELVAGEVDQARAALESLEQIAEGELRGAAALARVAWPAVATDRGALDDALSTLASLGAFGATLAESERTRLARDVDEDRFAWLGAAAAWAAVSPGAAAGFEWLAAAQANEDVEAERGAWGVLAGATTEGARAAFEAHSVIAPWLAAGGDPPALLASVEPAVSLVNLELAPAGCDPRRRASALRGLGGALGEATAVDALGLSGWSDLAAGDASTALRSFRRYVESYPDDPTGWEGVRQAATRTADWGLRAHACARLGELSRSDERGAALLEEAGLLWLEEARDESLGEQALAASFARDPRRPVAFDRLFRRVRARDEDDRLLELAGRRLEVVDDEREITKLSWEQARVLRKKGDLTATLEALETVRMFEPDHIGALVLLADVHQKQGAWAEAAEAYARLAGLRDAPAQQRLIAGMGAAKIFEERLADPTRAFHTLNDLHRSNVSTPAVRERLAVLAGKANAWSAAAAAFEELMLERDSAEGRVEAARLAMAIWRDKLDDPRGAKRAVVRLLEEAPADGEALDLVLATEFEPKVKAHALGTGKSALLQQIQKGALDADVVGRLARLARATDDPALTQIALGVLVSLGRDDARVSDELGALDARSARAPQIQIDARTLQAIGDPADSGPIVKLFEALGEVLSEALGPSRDALGVGRRERVDARSGLPLRNDIAAWAGALGLGEFELFVGGKDANAVQGVGGEIPALVVGANVKHPLTPAARSAIARELFALRRGISVVRTRDDATVGSVVVAACNLAEIPIEAPQFAILGDVQRQLGKALSRKVKKMLPDLCREVAASRPDVRGWARAAQRSLDRAATVAAGDVALVLTDTLGVPRADLRRQVVGNERAERLLRFVLSPQYLELRNRLGMGVR